MFNHVWVGSAVVLVVENRLPGVYLTQAYIQHRHRAFGVLCIFHVLVLDLIVYDNSYSTIWRHMFLCVDQKNQWWKLVCIPKYFNIFMRDTIIILHMITSFCPLPFTCPFFSFALINYSMFVCCIIQVFF